MSNFQSYQHPITPSAAQVAHEAAALSRGSQNPVRDHSDSYASHQTMQPPEPTRRIDWSNGGVTRYQHMRDYTTQGEPEVEGISTSDDELRASGQEVTTGYGDERGVGDPNAGEKIDLSNVDTGELANRVASDGGLSIRELITLQDAGIPEEFSSEVADVIAGRESREIVEAPPQFTPFIDEYWRTGTVSEASLQRLEGLGVSRLVVQRMIAGRAKIEERRKY